MKVVLDVNGENVGHLCDMILNITGRWRTLPPAGGVASPLSLFNAHRSIRQRGIRAQDELRQQLERRFEKRHILFTASGTEALYAAFLLLRRESECDTVIVTAYSCPQIVTAAVAAGLRVRLADNDQRTLEADPCTVAGDNSRSVFIASNLYGLRDDLGRWRDASRAIIDDGCQGGLSRDAGGRIGARTAIGVLSFGRGKALCGVGGGALLLDDERNLSSGGGDRRVGMATLLGLIAGTAMSVLEHPAAYWVPARIPFLHLGETKYQRSFAAGPLTELEALHALEQLEHERERAMERVKIAKNWHESLVDAQGVIEPFIERGLDFDGESIPIRYPILLPDAQIRDRALRLLRAFGASPSYPAPLNTICVGAVENARCPRALEISRRIITLPTHRFVSEGDIAEATEILRDLC